MKTTLLIILFSSPLALLGQVNKLSHEFSMYSGEYLGQSPPGIVPQKFSPGFISTDSELIHCLVFSPDGNHLVYSWADTVWHNWGMYYSRKIDNKWLKPFKLRYKGDEQIPFNPTFSADSKNIIFSMVASEWPNTDIYSIELSTGGYSSIPKRLDLPINTNKVDFGYCIGRDGSIYFAGQRDEEFMGGLFDIYVCKKEKDTYVTRNLSILNSPLDDAAPYISPDGSYLLYEQMVNDTGLPYNDSTARVIRIDLFVSFLDKNKNWSKPVSLGTKINSGKYKTYRPVISSDGKYLFYSQGTARKRAATYWVSTKFIESLRP